MRTVKVGQDASKFFQEERTTYTYVFRGFFTASLVYLSVILFQLFRGL